jgi:1,4-dihydroxy-2-naphthoate octaprenyltransferase
MSAAPVLLGATLAWSEGAEPQWLVFIFTLFCALAIQAGTNLYNDVRDAERGGDGPDRHGPLRVTAAGLATARQVKRAAFAAFGAAFAGGLFLVFVGGLPILVIGIASLLAGFAYSGGSRPLSHTPWGEIFVLLFFGIAAVSGTYYLQLGEPRISSVLLGVMLGLQAAAVLLVNNVRDLAADRASGRRTLAGLIGERRSRWLYGAFMLLPFVLLFWLPAAQGLWGAWLILPVSIWLVWTFRDVPVGPVMNRHLALTAQTQALMAILISAGLLLR